MYGIRNECLLRGERAEHLGQHCLGRELRLEVVERQLPQAVKRQLCSARSVIAQPQPVGEATHLMCKSIDGPARSGRRPVRLYRSTITEGIGVTCGCSVPRYRGWEWALGLEGREVDDTRVQVVQQRLPSTSRDHNRLAHACWMGGGCVTYVRAAAPRRTIVVPSNAIVDRSQ